MNVKHVCRITGKELCKNSIAVGVTHMHIFGDTHTYINKKYLWHAVCMSAASLVTPHAPSSANSHRTKGFFQITHSLLSTSEALFTLTTPQSERGS